MKKKKRKSQNTKAKARPIKLYEIAEQNSSLHIETMKAIEDTRQDIAALRIEVMNALERGNAQVEARPVAQREQEGSESGQS